jgi:hypothetical protein
MKLQIGLPLMFIGRSTIFVYANGVNITNNINISHNKDYVEIIKILINMIKNLNHVTFALNIKNLTIFTYYKTTPLSWYHRCSRNWKYILLHCLFSSEGPHTPKNLTTKLSAMLTYKAPNSIWICYDKPFSLLSYAQSSCGLSLKFYKVVTRK